MEALFCCVRNGPPARCVPPFAPSSLLLIDVRSHDLAEVADVKPVTIRARWDELRTLVDDDGD